MGLKVVTLVHTTLAGRFLAQTAVDLSVRNEKIEKVIYVNDTGRARDAYAINYVVEAHNSEPARPYFILDADSGAVLKQWNGIAHFDYPYPAPEYQQTGSGPGGNKKTGLYKYGIDRPFLFI